MVNCLYEILTFGTQNMKWSTLKCPLLSAPFYTLIDKENIGCGQDLKMFQHSDSDLL